MSFTLNYFHISKKCLQNVFTYHIKVLIYETSMIAESDSGEDNELNLLLTEKN
jgi:hypothetical protein